MAEHPNDLVDAEADISEEDIEWDINPAAAGKEETLVARVHRLGRLDRLIALAPTDDDVMKQMVLAAPGPVTIRDFTDDEVKVEEIAIVASDTLHRLEDFLALPSEVVSIYRALFLRLDSDKDYLITAMQLLEALLILTKRSISSGVLTYLFQLLEFIPENPSDRRVLLSLPKGSFLDPKDSFRAHVNFERVTFKQFVLVATLALRFVSSSDEVKQAMMSVRQADAADLLKRGMGLFRIHIYGTKSNEMQLDDLEIELKASGSFSQFEQDKIMSSIRDTGVESLTFLEYLTFLPLFMNIHGNILTNPLGN